MNRINVTGRRSAPGAFALIPLIILALSATRAWAQNSAYEFAFGIGGSTTSDEKGSAVVFDANGRLHVAGIIAGSVDLDPGPGEAILGGSGLRSFIACYEADGSYVWGFPLGQTNGRGPTIAVAANGDIVVAGSFAATADFDPGPGSAVLAYNGQHGIEDMFVARYTANGAYMWAFAVKEASPAAMDIDGTGDVVVGGSFIRTADFDPGPKTAAQKDSRGAAFIARYTGAGAYRWAVKIAGSGVSVDNLATILGLAIGADGNVWITGQLRGTVAFGGTKLTASGADVFVARYGGTGAFGLAFRIGGTGSDLAEAIALDENDGVYVTGSFQSTVDFNPGSGTANLVSQGHSDIFVAKYSSAGAYTWAHSVGGPGRETATDLTLDGAGDVQMAAIFEGAVDFDPGSGSALLASASTTGQVNAAIARYDANGGFVSAFALPSTALSSIRTIDVDANGTIGLAGIFAGTVDFDPGVGEASIGATSYDIFVASYVPAMLPRRSVPFRLSQGTRLFPNPFTHDVTLELEPNAGETRIEIVDVHGTVVEAASVSGGGASRHGATLSAGTYVVRVNGGDDSRCAIVRKTR